MWGNILVKDPDAVSPLYWGWQQELPNSAPTPLYTTTPIISQDLPELVIFQCKTECKARCKCFGHQQPCMLLCWCKGLCSYTAKVNETDAESLEEA